MRSATFCALVAAIAIPTPGRAECLRGSAPLNLEVAAPTEVCVSASELAVLEGPARRLRIFSPSGVTVAEVDVGEKPLGLARLDDGTYLVGDRPGRRVLRVDPMTESVSIFSSGFSGIAGLARDGSRVLVLEPVPPRVVELDLAGSRVASVVLHTDAVALHDLAFDRAGQRWLTLDPAGARGLAFNFDGSLSAEFGGFGSADGEISRTGSIACDGGGRIYLTDRFQGTLTVFEPDAGLLCAVTAADLSSSPLVLPTDLHVEDDGTVYVASSGSGEVHVLDLMLQASQQPGAQASPSMPVGDQVVGLKQVRLISAMEASSAGSAELSLQFELVVDATGAVVATSQPVALTSMVADGPTLRGEGSWAVPIDLEQGVRYRWRVRAIRANEAGSWSAWATFIADDLPDRLEVMGNRPNPFNPRTEIFFSLPAASRVEIVIADVRGREVRRIDLGELDPGPHSALWNGEDAGGSPVSSGVYFYLVRAGLESRTGKMVLVR